MERGRSAFAGESAGEGNPPAVARLAAPDPASYAIGRAALPHPAGAVMAKPLGPKSMLIRDAIKSNPGLGNTEIAQLINGSDDRSADGIEVQPNDVAAQKQAMKK